jgi:hypothetical protein
MCVTNAQLEFQTSSHKVQIPLSVCHRGLQIEALTHENRQLKIYFLVHEIYMIKLVGGFPKG